jgi:hypothetical protein
MVGEIRGQEKPMTPSWFESTGTLLFFFEKLNRYNSTNYNWLHTMVCFYRLY